MHIVDTRIGPGIFRHGDGAEHWNLEDGLGSPQLCCSVASAASRSCDLDLDVCSSDHARRLQLVHEFTNLSRTALPHPLPQCPSALLPLGLADLQAGRLAVPQTGNRISRPGPHRRQANPRTSLSFTETALLCVPRPPNPTQLPTVALGPAVQGVQAMQQSSSPAV